VDAEGCFYVTLTNDSTGVGLVFKVTQHIRDTDLLKEFIGYWNCGRYSISSKMGGDYIVTKYSDINMKIIPARASARRIPGEAGDAFLNKYPILGSKSLDFSDFEQVAMLMENKVHLTAEGFKQIRQIKFGMNRGRTYSEQSSPQISTSPFKCSQKRTYGTMSALPKFSSLGCQGNRHYSIKLNNTHPGLNENLFNE
jgi:hypothetical protein